MLSNKKIICPNNLIEFSKKVGVVDAAIVVLENIFRFSRIANTTIAFLITWLIFSHGFNIL